MIDFVYNSENPNLQIFLGSVYSPEYPLPNSYNTNFHHLVYTVTYTGSSQIATVYYNGVEIQTVTGMRYFQPTLFVLGREFNTNEGTGYLDQFRFFTASLSSSDVTKLYNNGVGI